MDDELKKSILKTGTSLVGIVCKDGVVMASDRRVTMGGQVIADKTFRKTYKINDYLVASIAGTLSDAQINLRVISSQLKLKELKDKKRPSIKEAASFISTMKFQNIRQHSMIPAIVGNLIAGFDSDGKTTLYNISPDGALKKIEEYDASGSGMIYIWGMLEKNYKEGLSVEEGINLAADAIQVAIERDPASGNGIDIFAITKDGIKQVSKQKGEWTYTEQY
jgi:proteasome beta subunit